MRLSSLVLMLDAGRKMLRRGCSADVHRETGVHAQIGIVATSSPSSDPSVGDVFEGDIAAII